MPAIASDDEQCNAGQCICAASGQATHFQHLSNFLRQSFSKVLNFLFLSSMHMFDFFKSFFIFIFLLFFRVDRFLVLSYSELFLNNLS